MKMNKAILLLVLTVLPGLGFSQYSIGNSDLRDGVNLDNAQSMRVLTGRSIHTDDDTRTQSSRSAESSRNVDPNIITEAVITFSPYFEDRIIDSFWQELRMIAKSSENTHSFGHIIDLKETEKSYLLLFKAMYGDSFGFLETRMSILTDTLLHKQTAEIIYKAISKKSKGLIDVVFDLGNNHNIVLHRINFFPFDYSSNTFIDNLCENEISLIKTQQVSILIDTVALYADAEKMKNIKALSKKLATIKLSSNILFTSRLMMEGDKLWVVGIYDTDIADERLVLGYKLVGKKFKPALVEISKKGG